jgi:RNA-binding motif X-linked protein 2
MVTNPNCSNELILCRHDDFKDSAYIFVGGLPYELTEGDVLCVFSQYGEILDLNYARDQETGKPKGFAFLKYDDQRSTVLAVDNFNGATLLGRTLRVDHSRDYRQKSKKRRRRRDESESEESSEEELDDEGKPRVKGFNVAPKGWLDPPVEIKSESEEDDLEEGIDPDDPMRDYLIEKRREERAAGAGGKREKKHRKKIKKEDGEERRHRHRSSRKDGEERHRHHHSHRRIEDGKDEERRRERTPRKSRRERDETPEQTLQKTPPSQSQARVDTPPRSQRIREDTPEQRTKPDRRHSHDRD